MTEQSGPAREISIFGIADVERKDSGRPADSNPKTRATKDPLEGYRQNLDRLSNALDDYFSIRRLIP